MHNKLPVLFFACVMSITSIFAGTPNKLQNIFVQKNGKLITLDNAIIQMNGKISEINDSNKYDVKVQNKIYSINLDSTINATNAIDFLVNLIAPDNIKVNLYFISSIPENWIYWDNDNTGIQINKDGTAEITTLYPERGPHRIELRKNGHVNAKDKLKVISKTSITCVGEINMKCNPKK